MNTVNKNTDNAVDTSVKTSYVICNWPKTDRSAMAMGLAYHKGLSYVYVDRVMYGVNEISVTFKRFMDVIKPMDVDTIIRNGNLKQKAHDLYFGTDCKRGAKQAMINRLVNIDDLAKSLFKSHYYVDDNGILVNRELSSKGEILARQEKEELAKKEEAERKAQATSTLKTPLVREILYIVVNNGDGHVLCNATVEDMVSIDKTVCVNGVYRPLKENEYRKWKITKANKAKVGEFLKKVSS